MRTIRKYQITGSDIIMVPAGAVPVLVGTQKLDDQTVESMIWLEVDTEQPMVKRHFVVVGTGRPIPESGVHVGSYQMPPFVWHVYDLRRVEDE